MEQRLDIAEASVRLDEVVERAATRDEACLIERDGAPVAAVVPLRVWEAWQRETDRMFEVMEEAARRANMTEEEGQALIEEAISAIRAKRRAAAAARLASRR